MSAMPARAPMDPSLLEPCLAPWPQEAKTLPAEAYLSPEVFAWERERFFDASWVCVGRSDDLSSPGDQRALRIGREGVLLVRQRSGRLMAFSNTCRHRGHELLDCGAPGLNRDHVRCPYHRWIYELDGGFKGGPGLASQSGFDRSDPDHDLLEARAAEWGGWVFVNASGDAYDFDRHAGALTELIADYEPERLRVGAVHSYELQANWKVICENYHECYHCSEIHPELCVVSSPGSGSDYEPSGAVIGGSMELLPHAETMSLDGKSSGVPFRRLGAAGRREVYYVQMWPNLLLSIHPDYVMTHRLEPLGPGVTRVECAWLWAPESFEHPGFDTSYASEFWDLTNRQDWAACEAVQRGMSGRGYRQGPLSDQEGIVHQCMAQAARGYLNGGLVPVGAGPRLDEGIAHGAAS